MTLKNRPAVFQLLLFLSVWFAFGLTVNSGNLIAFGLQQAGVEAYVERHHFYLEGSQVGILKVQPVVDAFLYNGHIYPAKQPGQFMLGAVAYWPIHTVGLNYSSNYLLTAALVTFLTASFVTALSVWAVFRIAYLLQDSKAVLWPLTIALIYAFATTSFPYSGIAWHDSIATGYIVMAFYLLLEIRRGNLNQQRSQIFSALAGLLLGLTLATSMLPFFMLIVMVVYFVTLRHWKFFTIFVIGGLVGLTPLLIYNLICFGNPLLMPNIAGSYSDTFFRVDRSNFFSKVRFYAQMLTFYAPIFWCGIVGLFLFPRRLRNEQVLLSCLLLASVIYILNIEATGTCQYGPRYLLPAMPLAMIGLIGFSSLSRTTLRRVLTCIVLVCAAISVVINLVGALYGAMLCDFPHFAVGLYVSQMLNGQLRLYPLTFWLLIPFLLASVSLVREAWRDRCRSDLKLG